MVQKNPTEQNLFLFMGTVQQTVQDSEQTTRHTKSYLYVLLLEWAVKSVLEKQSEEGRIAMRLI